ncbi:hypothetical protein BDP27DRAFT_1523082 [Rhodocollybia butyracea]|uniref:Uncharacterized protein n=1 Tax=Rhodocollybia butyracea TaxID=206335 RepID=A0A9P5P697_9AGAR|nr:hypothetical protein BDP27DRAFT_1523082 [Rhodocollybia butyracea]
MSDSESRSAQLADPNVDDIDIPTTLAGTCSVQMQMYDAKITGRVKKVKKLVKGSKKTKSFSFTFTTNPDNYLELMSQILVKCGLDEKFKVSVRRVFQMKIQVPGEKKSEARDIDDESEYLEVAEKIIEMQSSKAIAIFVDMQQIERGAKKISSKDDDDSEDSPDENGLTQTQAQLVRFRELLSKEHGNTNKNGLTIIDKSNGLPVRLSNVAIENWMDNEPGVTIKDPPADDALFQATTLPNLSVPDRRRGRSSSTPDQTESPLSEGTTMLGHLATIISSISDRHSRSRSPSQIPPTATSPAKNSPTKLPRFLQYAEKNLSIGDATSYRFCLEQARFGPDILALVDNKALTDIGIPEGDVIRLKQAAPLCVDAEPEPKRFRFERRWVDGSGAATMFGTAHAWYYYSEEIRALVPVPPGFIAILDKDEF